MTGGITLDQDETAEALARAGSQRPQEAATLLADLGYALVAVSGYALDRAREQAATLPEPAPDQAERVDRWFAPERTS
jgi:hypothetical protein